MRSLYERGLSREDIILELFRLVDWILALSAENSKLFEEELARYEEEKKMPYVTSVERIGIKKGLQRGLERGRRKGRHEGQQEGRQELLLAVLESRFQSVPPGVQDGIRALRDPGVLTDLGRQAATADSMDSFVQDLAAATRRELPLDPAQP